MKDYREKWLEENADPSSSSSSSLSASSSSSNHNGDNNDNNKSQWTWRNVFEPVLLTATLEILDVLDDHASIMLQNTFRFEVCIINILLNITMMVIHILRANFSIQIRTETKICWHLFNNARETAFPIIRSYNTLIYMTQTVSIVSYFGNMIVIVGNIRMATD